MINEFHYIFYPPEALKIYNYQTRNWIICAYFPLLQLQTMVNYSKIKIHCWILKQYSKYEEFGQDGSSNAELLIAEYFICFRHTVEHSFWRLSEWLKLLSLQFVLGHWQKMFVVYTHFFKYDFFFNYSLFTITIWYLSIIVLMIGLVDIM